MVHLDSQEWDHLQEVKTWSCEGYLPPKSTASVDCSCKSRKTQTHFIKQVESPQQPQRQCHIQRQARPVLVTSGTFNSRTWGQFIEVKKLKNKDWYGTSELIRSPAGFSIVCCKSLKVPNKRHAQIIILRGALGRVKEFDVECIMCWDLNEE